MTQAQIDNLNNLSREIRDIPKKARIAEEQATKIWLEEVKKCDHKYPDGTTAWEDGFMFTHCKICGANDL